MGGKFQQLSQANDGNGVDCGNNSLDGYVIVVIHCFISFIILKEIFMAIVIINIVVSISEKSNVIIGVGPLKRSEVDEVQLVRFNGYQYVKNDPHLKQRQANKSHTKFLDLQFHQ